MLDFQPLSGYAVIAPVFEQNALNQDLFEDEDRQISSGLLVSDAEGIPFNSKVFFGIGMEVAIRQQGTDFKVLSLMDQRLPGDLLILPIAKILASE